MECERSMITSGEPRVGETLLQKNRWVVVRRLRTNGQVHDYLVGHRHQRLVSGWISWRYFEGVRCPHCKSKAVPEVRALYKLLMM